MSRRQVWCCAEFVLWFVLTTAIYCGNPQVLTTQICQGTEPVTTVPVFNLWTLEWNIDRLEHGLRDYWQAPIFAPQNGAFAFSEPQPHTMLLAPVARLCGSVFAYNLVFLVYLTLNGWVLRGLLAEWGSGALWSRAGGGLGILLPFVSWQSGVLQLTAVWGPIAVIWCVWRLQQQPGWTRAVSLGGVFGLSYWACNYYALFVTILAPALLILCGRRLREVAFWRSVLLAIGVAALLIAPLAVNQAHYLRQVESTRSAEMIDQLSALSRDYFTNRNVRLQLLDTTRWGHPERTGWYLGSGSILLLMTIVGCGGLFRSGRKAMTGFWLMWGGLAFVASQGTLLRWGTFAPYAWLMTWYPGLGLIRSPYRFALFVQLAQVGLVVEGLQLLEQWGRAWFTSRPPVENEVFTECLQPASLFWQRCGVTLARAYPLLAVVLIAVQIYPGDLRWCSIPPHTPDALWIQWLRHNTASGDPVLCLPLPAGGDVAQYESTPHWMRHGLDHRRPLVNGYSGFFPQHFLTIRDLLDPNRYPEETEAAYTQRLRSYPPPEAIAWLRAQRIQILVVHDAAMSADQLIGLQRFPKVLEDSVSGITLYRLHTE